MKIMAVLKLFVFIKLTDSLNGGIVIQFQYSFGAKIKLCS